MSALLSLSTDNAKDPAAQETADNTDDDGPDQTEAVVHDFTGDDTCQRTNQN